MNTNLDILIIRLLKGLCLHFLESRSGISMREMAVLAQFLQNVWYDWQSVIFIPTQNTSEHYANATTIVHQSGSSSVTITIFQVLEILAFNYGTNLWQLNQLINKYSRNGH